MGLFDFGKKKASGGKGDRFAPISAEDELLLPRQIEWMRDNLPQMRNEIVQVQDASDPMLPECAMLVPNLLMEFRQDEHLAMVHGLGLAHAWVRSSMLEEAIRDPDVTDYRSLFVAFQSRGWSVKRIRYVRFKSAIGRSY